MSASADTSPKKLRLVPARRGQIKAGSVRGHKEKQWRPKGKQKRGKTFTVKGRKLTTFFVWITRAASNAISNNINKSDASKKNH